MTEPAPMRVCPMAETCKAMMTQPISKKFFMIPGIFLIVLGLAVLVEPRIVVWLVGLAFIAMGCMVLIGSRIMRGLSQRMQLG